jgi:Ca2+/Na+ antiporter
LTALCDPAGHDDVGLGTLLGSNLFNGLAIVGVAATIHPIHASLAEVARALAFGVLAVLLNAAACRRHFAPPRHRAACRAPLRNYD